MTTIEESVQSWCFSRIQFLEGVRAGHGLTYRLAVDGFTRWKTFISLSSLRSSPAWFQWIQWWNFGKCEDFGLFSWDSSRQACTVDWTYRQTKKKKKKMLKVDGKASDKPWQLFQGSGRSDPGSPFDGVEMNTLLLILQHSIAGRGTSAFCNALFWRLLQVVVKWWRLRVEGSPTGQYCAFSSLFVLRCWK